MSLLDIKNLCVSYKSKAGPVKAVDQVSFTIDKGDTVGIVGESGSGKTTLAMAVLRLLNPRSAEISGEVNFLGTDLLHCSEDELTDLRWIELAVVFQKSMNSFSPVHRIRTQIEDVYRVHFPDASDDEIYKRLVELLEVVNLTDRVLSLYPHELSGGMRQRVAIAMSLLHQPSLLILDEATVALDVVTQGQILKEINRLEEELGVTTMIITHDVSVVARACKKIVVMYAGQLMEMGDVEKVLVEPLHPYTQSLMSSFPTLTGCRVKLESIPGSMPDLANPPQGCIFAKRCQKAMPVCLQKRPESRWNEGHQVACHLYGGEQHG